MNREENIQNLKNKIENIERKIKIEPNSCVGLQRENIDSFETDILYLKKIKKELLVLEENKDFGICEICHNKIEDIRIKINPTTKRCKKCK